MKVALNYHMILSYYRDTQLSHDTLLAYLHFANHPLTLYAISLPRPLFFPLTVAPKYWLKNALALSGFQF